ncbi:Hypothetical protein ABZS17D1_01960 [Kosakonia cowanii]
MFKKKPAEKSGPGIGMLNAHVITKPLTGSAPPAIVKEMCIHFCDTVVE